MHDLSALLKKMNIRRRYIILLILRSPFDILRTWMLAGLMRAVFSCLETENTDRLPVVCVCFGVAGVLLFLYNGTIWSIYAAFAAGTEGMLQRMLLHKLLRLPVERMEGQRGGEWLTKLNNDIHMAGILMNGPLNMPHMVVSLINTFLSSCLMLRDSLPMLIATWAFLLPHLLLHERIVLRSLPGLQEEAQRALEESTAAIAPLITEADTILLYDAGPMLIKRCGECSSRLMKINSSMHLRKTAGTVVLQLFGSGGYLFVLFMGYQFMRSGRMDFSDVTYCFQIRGSILAGMFMLMASVSNIKTNSVCVRRIRTALEETGKEEYHER